VRRVLGAVAALFVCLVTAGCGGAADSRDAAVDRERSREVRELLLAIDQGEVCHRRFHGRYTGSVADLELMVGGKVVGSASELGLGIELDASTTGASYVVRLRGQGVDTYLSRRGSDFVDLGDSGVFRDGPPDRCARSGPSPYRPAG
jgi:hypothetical protein